MDAGTRHRHVPDPDTAYTVSSLKADLSRKYDYPLEALCLVCNRWLRVDAAGAPPRLKYPNTGR